jgi:hypothetical protein
MLNITVPSATDSRLKFSTFERYGLPAPRNGVQAEVNDDLILRFEDEEDAFIYAGQLENLSLGLDDKSSPQNLAIGDMIMAIRGDQFVQSYMEEN